MAKKVSGELLQSRILNRLEISIFVILIIIISIRAHQRNGVWGNEYSLWSDAASKSPEKARPHNNLGRAYRENDLLNKAAVEFKKAIDLDNYPPAHSNLGSLYIVWGWYGNAEKEVKAALNSGPEFPDLHNMLGIIYGKKGLWDKAIEELEMALEIDPDYKEAMQNIVWAYTEKGFALGGRGRYREAIEGFKKAISIDRNDPAAHYGLGLAYEEGLDRKEEALKHWDEFIRVAPENSPWREKAVRHIRRLEGE